MKIDYKLIDSDEKLEDFRKYLYAEKITEIAMDFEGEFNLHCYGEKLCLIQIFDGKYFHIIDPFKISTEGLKKILESKIVKIFFDASSDRMLIYRQYKIQLKSVLDLKNYVDVLEFEKRGLNSVLNEMMNIQVVKKFQKYNWMKRPVDTLAMQYALEDVKYLFELRNALYAHIVEQNQIPQLITAIVQQDIDYTKKSIPAIQKRKTYKLFSRERKALADKIFDLRERTAQKIDWPPNNVLSNDDIIRLAQGGISKSDIPVNKKVREKERITLIAQIQKLL